MFLGGFTGVFRIFHGCFKDTSRLFQESFNLILEYVMEVPRVFLGIFIPIKFAYITEMTSVHNSKPFLTIHHKTPLKHNTDTFESS